jgi:hypothetical protein
MKFLNMMKVATLPSMIIILLFSSNILSEDYSELTKEYDEKYSKLGIPYRKEFKDNVVYILPDTISPDALKNRQDPNNKVDVMDSLDKIKKEGLKRFEEASEKIAQETGEAVMYIMEGDPKSNGEFEYFTLPQDKLITGCMYTRGYTYPDHCSSDDGVLIFQAGKDPQSKLDEIARSQGKLSEYNKVPPNYDPEGCQIDTNGINHPCDEIKVVDLISQSGTNEPTNSNTALP